MSLHPQSIPPVPQITAKIAQAAFRNGNLYLTMRQELGTLFTDEDFAAVYPRRGRPAWTPWRLALITLMQFVENLSDRQAADAVRARIDWKYALSLDLDDAGFDFSLLCEFRERLVEGNVEHLLLDRMLELFQEKKLLKARGRQRTDSTHVLTAIRVMNRLELVTETLRAALNELATVAPDWLREVAPASWYERYSLRAEQSRLPKGEKARQEYAQTVGQDGDFLLQALEQEQPKLQTLERVQTLKQVWERHYARSEVGEIIWRKEADLARPATAIESPYDTEARHSSKHELRWTGYKVHLTETCDPDLPRLITNVHTTVATTQDVSCTKDIHQALADKGLRPSRHLVDTGYVDAELLVHSHEQHQIELLGPTRIGASWRNEEGCYDQSQFVVDWEKKQVTCPEGQIAYAWSEITQQPYDYPLVRAHFATTVCRECPSRDKCVRSPSGRGRSLVFHRQAEQEALQQARARITTEEGRLEYRKRAGIEGSLSQGVRRSDLRHCRYRGLAKTHLQHVATAAGLNLVRVTAHLRAVPLAKTRVSRFAKLLR
jgi:transposase